MTTICIFVIGLLYDATCATSEHVYPVGVCHHVDDALMYCTATPEQFPARPQPYHPTWGGGNCVEPCDELGGGTKVEDAYNWAVACPQGLFESIVEFEHAGIWQCLDHGGEIRLRFERVYTNEGFKHLWHFPIDFLLRPENEYPNWLYVVGSWEVVEYGK